MFSYKIEVKDEIINHDAENIMEAIIWVKENTQYEIIDIYKIELSLEKEWKSLAESGLGTPLTKW